jgi:hypothetical protein
MNADTMTFGVEIECYVPRDAALAPPRGWRAKTDGSLTAPPASRMRGAEVVSPILSGAAGLAQVYEACLHLNAIGARVNYTCGLHVHVGIPRDQSFDGSALRRLGIHVANVEKALYASTGTRAREQAAYAGRICYSKPIRDAFRVLKRVREEGLYTVAAEMGSDKYRALNVNNLRPEGKHTVEFRCFAGTTSAVKITAYAMLCMGLVEFSHASKVAQPYDPKPTAGKSSRYQGGEGLVAVNRLLMHLGWIAGYKRPKKYGVPAGSEGLLAGAMKELRRLAARYDATANPQTNNSDA